MTGDRTDSPGGQGPDYDVVVVGSGFGGAVAALRLTEKGYRVGVLEAGRRFAREELPKNSFALRDYLWAPRLGMYGIQRIHLLGKAMVLAGAGVGGGSLNYANTLYVPPREFFQDRQWAGITDWQQELAPYYDQAQRMLGARLNPTTTVADEHLRAAAESMGVGGTFHATPVGVFFGDGRDAGGAAGARAAAGAEVADPYFGGAGPSRRACVECGECMTGCRRGAKNTLNENYLHLAERGGAVIHPMTTATRLEERADGTLAVHTVPTDRQRSGPVRVFTARWVVLAAGTYGTQTLLHRMADEGVLPRLSRRLGELTRTNSESLVGALTFPRRYRARWGRDAELDFTKGVAITSSIHPDEHTHIENVRYGKGSNLMALICVPQYRVGGRLPKPLAAAWAFARHPVMVGRTITTRGWSEHTIIGLVMQTRDNSLRTLRKPRGFKKGLLTAVQGHGEPNPVHIPQGAEAARALAERINGFAGTNIGELTGRPLTAHFLGGCPIGASPEDGVVDPYHRLYGHPGISVVDGAAVSANLGVNPALTITAQAERAMALWPNAGEEDPRPAPGAAYRRLAPVAPRWPAVPKGAFGQLLLPVPEVPAKEE
ncbi:FAD-dependent oxidoreductase [Phaeacidiphilus oryzae]|uniref:FAD-dependent oxidoreductase n=1 Tax=Phaeacidiphilus oryzae TaxID=348818 RepID=UPI00068F485F|nr:FAD-dependent oxidoreductase [Phaeacidiphilus oryzae]